MLIAIDTVAGREYANNRAIAVPAALTIAETLVSVALPGSYIAEGRREP
jgi:hypothetical protein